MMIHCASYAMWGGKRIFACIWWSIIIWHNYMYVEEVTSPHSVYINVVCLLLLAHAVGFHNCFSVLHSHWIPYSAKLSRERTFTSFTVDRFRHFVKVFSVKWSLLTNPWKFSPSKVSRYTVIASGPFSSFSELHTDFSILSPIPSFSILHETRLQTSLHFTTCYI